MASYKAEAGAILQPGNQINRLSSYNTEGVFGWPGFEALRADRLCQGGQPVR